MSKYTIKNIPEDERPRERLARHGAESLSSTELIAIVLGSGTKTQPVMEISQEIVSRFGSLRALGEATLAELCQVKGVGMAKAMQLKAAFSLGIRASRQTIAPKYRIDHPLHAYNLVKDEMEQEKRELFVVILQDARGFVICHEVISVGTLTSALVHPREVFYPAIRHKAASLILAHNHPSGDHSPSTEDYEITNNLIDVGILMNIPVYDHLIIGQGGYTSLRQRGVKFTPQN
jgi:DNA repair protein RadC